MTDLNELFEQILHSERKFKARIDELKLRKNPRLLVTARYIVIALSW